MNIFILDRDITRCAQYHCDQHVAKMILESAQLLCTALSKKGFETPYRPTHAGHPCVRWVETSWDNFLWLSQLAMALNQEYRYRYDKDQDHASIRVIRQVRDLEFESVGLTPFVQAMPEQYKDPEDPVRAYRSFYSGEKASFATWTRRSPPPWWLKHAA